MSGMTGMFNPPSSTSIPSGSGLFNAPSPSTPVVKNEFKTAAEVTWGYKFRTIGLGVHHQPGRPRGEIAAFGVQWARHSHIEGRSHGDTYKDIIRNMVP